MTVMVLSGLRGVNGPDEMGKCWDDDGAPVACPGVGSGSGTGAGTTSGGPTSATNLDSIFRSAGAFVQGLFSPPRSQANVAMLPPAQPAGFPWGLVIGGVAVVGVGFAAYKVLK